MACGFCHIVALEITLNLTLTIFLKIYFMKKLFLTLGVACMALTGFASTRVLYQQNFEKVTTPAEAGWGDYRGLMTIASDEYGKFLEINQNGQNGGSTYVKWGQEVFLSEGESVLENGTYNVHFEYMIKNSTCNQYNSAITIFTNEDPGVNQPYRNRFSPAGYWQNYLFDVSQVDDGNTKDALQYVIDGATKVNESTAEDGTVTTSYSIDYSDPTTLAENVWYVIDMTVDVYERTVEYQMQTITGEIIKGGTLTVPETNIADGSAITMYAEGLNVMLARNNTTYDIDNIMISTDTEADYANDPTVALTRIGRDSDDQENLNIRAYTISFMDGETLHVIGTDGAEESVDYAECDGEYVYETTTSGTLKAWTTCGEAQSEVIEAQVECVPVALPEAIASISAVGTDFAKNYVLTVSNADVPLQPTIFIDYEYTGKEGEKIAEKDQASGCSLEVTQEGTLTITTKAFGYQPTTVTVTNDSQFETKKVWDFARMTKEEIAAAGFPAEFTVLNSDQTSGFNNWTARKRLYYESPTETEDVLDADGNVTETRPLRIYPFGFVAEDNTTNVLEYSVIDRTGVAETAKGELFEGLTIFPERGKVDEGSLPNVGMLYHIGLYNDQTKNNNNNVYIHDLAETDFVVVNSINNYGGNSNHPKVATDDEYYAVLAGDDAAYSVAQKGVLNEETGTYDVIHALYRIDTAITKITVYQQKGAGDAVKGIESTVAGDNYWYSIDGVRVAEPTRPGLYIHNGKKIIVK